MSSNENKRRKSLAVWLKEQRAAHDRGELNEDQLALHDRDFPGWRSHKASPR